MESRRLVSRGLAPVGTIVRRSTSEWYSRAPASGRPACQFTRKPAIYQTTAGTVNSGRTWHAPNRQTRFFLPEWGKSLPQPGFSGVRPPPCRYSQHDRPADRLGYTIDQWTRRPFVLCQKSTPPWPRNIPAFSAGSLLSPDQPIWSASATWTPATGPRIWKAARASATS